jgi:adenylyltransferase/sulfurtransferase
MEGLKEENERLKQRIAVLEGKLLDPLTLAEPFEPIEALTIEEIERFGRQLVIPNFGIQSNKRRMVLQKCQVY